MNRPRKRDKHLPPCVYFKHGAYWYVKAGKWDRIGSTMPEALAEYARRLSQPKGGVADLIDRAMPHITRGKAEATQAQYKQAGKILARKLAEFAPHQVKHKHMVRLLDSMVEHPNMANRVLTVARLVFNKAAAWGEVDANPCIGVERLPENKRTRLILMSEWQAIYEKAGDRLRVIMQVAYLTGQRIGDVLSIRRSQLVEAGVTFEQQKTDKKLTVKWTPELRAAIAEALALHGRVKALTLFLGKAGKPPNYRSVLLQWHTACQAAGVVDALPNDQRAQSLTSARRQGKNPTALAGHTGAATTARYLRDREATEVDGPSFGQALDVGQKS